MPDETSTWHAMARGPLYCIAREGNGDIDSKKRNAVDRVPPRSTYVLIITSEPKHTIPEAVRLRRALKCLLRTFGFQCVSIAPAPEHTNQPPAEPAGELK